VAKHQLAFFREVWMKCDRALLVASPRAGLSERALGRQSTKVEALAVVQCEGMSSRNSKI
jgi:hypothetical protein